MNATETISAIRMQTAQTLKVPTAVHAARDTKETGGRAQVRTFASLVECGSLAITQSDCGNAIVGTE